MKKSSEIISPVTGKEIVLNRKFLYENYNSIYPIRCISGTYYFYDNKIYNGRVGITKVKGIENTKKIPAMIYGYINII